MTALKVNESIQINGKKYTILCDEKNNPFLVEDNKIKTPYCSAYLCKDSNGNKHYRIEWRKKFIDEINNSQYMKKVSTKEEAQFICFNLTDMLDNVLNNDLKKKLKDNGFNAIKELDLK